jgi:quinol monooxygenase YgiN
MHLPCSVVELRQYTLHPGRRDALIDLFEREFIESQEACGLQLVGQFRDLDDPDRFVWLRGFADMAARAPALSAFYGGPAWAAHRDAANATMVDSDDVLLLRPLAGHGFPHETPASRGLVVAALCFFEAPVDDDFLQWFDHAAAPALAAAGGPTIARLVTESGRNEFPRLPVREGEQVFAWFSRFADEAAHRRHLAALEADAAWRHGIEPGLLRRSSAAPQVLRLQPTRRSRLA